MLDSCCSADDRCKGIAFKKVADIINAYPEKITSGKQVSHVKGVGKGSIAKVSNDFLPLTSLRTRREWPVLYPSST